MALELNESQMRQLLEALKEVTGIDYEERKVEETFRNKLKKLIDSCGYRDFNRLLWDVSYGFNKKLLQELINALTVNETYFFREKAQFEALVEYAIPEILKFRNPKQPVKILSAPCSTGEEVYSIMIYLLETGDLVERYDFMVLGIDIDTKAIEKAKEGTYNERSVHRLSEELIERYFVKKGKKYTVKRFLRSSANFKVVNVLDEEAMVSLGKFDVIFSRNMLIYFDDRTKRKVIDTFAKLLNPGGFLFLGHAEKVNGDKRFSSIRYKEAFFYKFSG